MKVVHFMSRFRLADGGVVRAVLDICAVLAQRGHDITVITWDASDLPESWKRGEAGLPRVVIVDEPRGISGMLDRKAVASIERHLHSADILHLHTPWERANLQLARMALRLGRPYVLTIHGMLDDWSMAQRRLKKRLYLAIAGRRLLDRASFIHCTAQGERDQANKWFPRTEGRIIPYLVNLEEFGTLPGEGMARREIAAAATDDPILLFLSRVHYKKRPEVLIDAAAILRDEGRKFRVLIAGTGDQPYIDGLSARIRERRLEDRVFFLGLVTGERKISLYQAADVFVLPTSQENFGLVLTEALACETPVVTTRGTDIWPELESSGGAMIVEGEARPTADAVAALLDDPARAKEMGRHGRAWVMKALDQEVIAQQFEAMYQDAIDAARR